jgi:hypothetical protein
VIAEISGWVIWPTFSSSESFESIRRTRASTLRSSLIRLCTRGQSDSVFSRSSIRAQPCSIRGLPICGCSALCAPLAPGTATTAASASSAIALLPGRR